MEWIILALLVWAWIVDRGKLIRRLAALEEATRDLRREFAARLDAPRPSPPPPTPKPAPRPAPTEIPVPSQWRPEVLAPLAADPEEEASGPAAGPASHDRAPREWVVLSWIRDYFTGGNLIVRVGVLVLFFGVAFLLKYAADHSHVPIELRLVGVSVGALALLGLGWRLRERRVGYALALQGAGVGILYLTVFAALRIYSLLPSSIAFGLLVGIGAFSAILAVRQNSMSFAAISITGGFLAPVLTATEQGNHVALFSYYALLDLSVFGIAWFRAWRPLNVLAFAFTFGISAIWGVNHYRPELLATTEPFLLLFFLIFAAIAVLFAFRCAPDLLHYVDGTLVFGTPVVVMGIQSGLVHHIPFALAYSALGFGAFYGLLAVVLARRQRDTLRLLVESCLALSVAFATLAIPLALEGRWTAACWALEGVAILWVGLRQQRRLAVAAGVILQFAAGAACLVDATAHLGETSDAASRFIAGLIVAVGGFMGSALTRRDPAWLKDWRNAISGALFCWGVAWWVYAGFDLILRVAPDPQQPALALSWLTLAALLLSGVAKRLDWALARLPPLWLFPAMVLAATAWLTYGHPGAIGGWWAWPLAIGVGYLALKANESALPHALGNALHVTALWLVTGLLTWEATWQVQQQLTGTWVLAMSGLPACLVLLALPGLARRGEWPVGVRADGYLTVAAGGLALYLGLWTLATDVLSNGDAAPLPYLPLLNPIDVTEGLAIVAMLAWLGRPATLVVGSWPPARRRQLQFAVAAVAFLWLNAMLLRSVHHWAQVPYDWDTMMDSTLTQASLSLFWTLLALTAMLWSARNGQRLPWFCGAALMGIVLVKLFLVDLSHIGTVPRIVSFLGVGTLMLVLGYFSPLPPARPEANP